MKHLYVFTFAILFSLLLSGCVQVSPYPPPTNPPPPPPPAPQKESKWIDTSFNLGKNSFRVNVTGQSNNPQKYRICLRNSAGGKNKGMDWKSGRKPIMIAKKRGQIVCNEYSPKKVSWKFYRIRGLKGYQNIGNYTFNAKGYAGKEVTFDWVRD